jgi:superoxide dismutase, Fe-Mn family
MAQPSAKSSSFSTSPQNTAAPAHYEAKKYDFSRVEGLSERALELHRGLYEGYVKETNALLPFVYPEATSEDKSVDGRLRNDGSVRRFAFEYNGMILHELFFDALRGKSGPPPASSAFLKAAERSFGSFDAWRSDVRTLAQTRGVGWVITTQLSKERRLANVWIDEHHHGLLADWRPVLAIDLWEHAYLIDYKPTERLSYLTTLFDNLDWQVIDARCF